MILIYTPKVTNRIKYTLDFIFGQYFEIAYELTDTRAGAVPKHNIFINYSEQEREGFFNIYQYPLLTETAIKVHPLFISRETSVESDELKGSDFPVFFQTTDHFDLKFDIFSCIFYLLSRYEEYLPHEKDIHGRYRSSDSILANAAFGFGPIVEVWLNELKMHLLRKDPCLVFKEYTFEYLPTFDIDNAYKYKNRNWLKNPPDLFKKECREVLRGIQKDPYDTHEFILEELKKTGQKSVFFFLLSDSPEFDSRVSPRSGSLHKIIDRCIKEGHDIGIHPSYFSFEENKTREQKHYLEEISKPVTFSRQHFLRICFPAYFRQLCAAGIRLDFSLGYPDVAGFRAGFSRPFYFFDLELNESTDLALQPSGWMDATFEYYQTKNYEEILQEFTNLLKQIRKINGKLVTIFHNDLIAIERYQRVFVFFNHHLKRGI